VKFSRDSALFKIPFGASLEEGCCAVGFDRLIPWASEGRVVTALNFEDSLSVTQAVLKTSPSAQPTIGK
jgi:hypothetical protein